MIKKVAFIAHPTTDLDASRRFFSEVLGLKESARYGDHWAEFKTPEGATIALDTFSPKNDPKAGPYLAFETDDLAAETARLREQGATVVVEPWENTDEKDKLVCKMAILRGPDGHSFMLHEIAPDRA